MLDATFWDLTSTSEPSEEAKEQTKHSVTKAQELFAQISDKDGVRDRSGPLALLELEKRAIAHGLSTGKCLQCYRLWPCGIDGLQFRLRCIVHNGGILFPELW